MMLVVGLGHTGLWVHGETLRRNFGADEEAR
jgi:hypothetical protein